MSGEEFADFLDEAAKVVQDLWLKLC